MPSLPVQLPPVKLKRSHNPLREVFFFLVAFVAMFSGAMLGLDVLL
ncbi:hypothetical protein GGR12_000616 [Brevundimonas lenta]|uniref:Uncharacterized protein n=1 Tax=Brevundimonas lenta TaxID=424796 RepID=A0A7W6JCR4_9CAUL|nr:hypothetical protein [Brevundimonas lenta]